MRIRWLRRPSSEFVCQPADRLRLRGWELDFGDFARSFGSLEVVVVALEAGPSGEDVVGEQADVGVVFLNGIVVALAFDGDAVFGAG